MGKRGGKERAIKNQTKKGEGNKNKKIKHKKTKMANKRKKTNIKIQ
jgi:hypothetical protein